MASLEVWICVDDNGDYATGNDVESARGEYENTVQPLADAGGFRLVCISVSVPLPTAIEASVNVPESDETPVVTVS